MLTSQALTFPPTTVYTETEIQVYENEHKFEIGKANFIKEGNSVAVFGCGITLHNELESAEQLAKDNINISVIDPFTG